MKKNIFKSVGSLLLFVMCLATAWFTWGVELLTVIGGSIVCMMCISAAILLWWEVTANEKGEKDG